MIEAFHVGAVSRGRKLWDGIDLAFDEGEVCVLTGPAGTGKTLLLSILRGERRPDEGDVVVGGNSLYRGDSPAVDSFRASSGVVPDAFPYLAGLSIRDLFLLSGSAGESIPAGEREERQEKLLSMMGIGGSQDWKLSSLSVTERARVALAAELFRGPKYLFLDMLIANAGGEWTDMLGGLFRALAREGKTILLAERTFPERWKARSGEEGIAMGPFRLFRLAVSVDGTR